MTSSIKQTQPIMAQVNPVQLISSQAGSSGKRAPLTEEEKKFRRASGLCMYCGTGGHLVRDCPIKPAVKQEDGTTSLGSGPKTLEKRTTHKKDAEKKKAEAKKAAQSENVGRIAMGRGVKPGAKILLGGIKTSGEMVEEAKKRNPAASQ